MSRVMKCYRSMPYPIRLNCAAYHYWQMPSDSAISRLDVCLEFDVAEVDLDQMISQLAMEEFETLTRPQKSKEVKNEIAG